MAKKNLNQGLFITFEGPEGSGKSTQAKLLNDYLCKEGYEVVFVHEPGATQLGLKIRSLLLDPNNKRVNPLAELLLYMASRAQLIEEKIKPALKNKKIVICDRFLDSTLAYQGYGLGMDLNLIKSLGKKVSQEIIPSLTIMLDLAPQIGLRRSCKTKDRIERRNLQYHRKVRNGYLSIAKAHPKKVKLISAKNSIENIHSEIKGLINKLININ